MKPQLVVLILAADLIFCVVVCALLWMFTSAPQSATLFGLA